MSWYPHDIDALLDHLASVRKAVSFNEEELKIARERLGVIATVMTCQWLNDDELDKVAKPKIKAIVAQWMSDDNEGDVHPCL